ncbi:site-specific DNA-methyltransferase [Gemmiger formicilis]|jgi:adenine-specific DNA-methyltransferase|uniref:site-specific DNA-methyltransferase n=1 Tax=Gemmiger formicilis TaxID=745368 RepID=UPI001D0DCD65|nr:site-specific DNA-methyltransferase [Gemmiger formicilis]MCC2192012.1 site-specific DNA-methyltransferase [Gemmiger formicilis]
MDKLKMQTENKADDNFKKLAAMFPNAVTETINENGEVVRAIDKDVLMQEISCTVVDGNEERYQFTWPDKKKSVLLANAPINKTLRPCREESVDFDTTENLYIEGDNLEVLKLLQETYLGKIKMIYIDPPYNTGNDFVYEDDFAQSTDEYLANSGQFDEDGNRMVQNTESNGRFHTDWLNMIYPRLRIAKNLLAGNGVIFISIDDNEIENMKKLCDEVYGATSFVAQLVWEKKKKGSFLSKSITNVKEYILVYCKNIDGFEGLIGEINDEEETYPCINAVNKRELRTIPAGIESKYRDKDFFMPKGSEISDTTMSIVLHSDLVIKNGVLAEELTLEGNWRYSQAAMKEYALKKELYITRDLYLRRIVRETRYKTMKDLLSRVGEDTEIAHTEMVDTKNLNSSGWGSNEDADEELRLIFGIQKLMDYPKPVRLLLKLLASYRGSDDYIVLDFFSGSATTAHATIKLNAQDGGKRKFIMVQLPELTDEKSPAYKAGYKTICEIGKERIRRAGAKIKEEAGLAAQNLDTGFRVLKCDTSNMKDVYYNPAEYEVNMFSRLEDNIKEDRTPEDLLFQVMLDLGVLLSSKIEETTIADKKVFNVEDNYLIACFDSDVSEETIKAIAKQKPYYFVMRDSSMASDSVATNFDQIFATYSPDTVRKVL